jgi:hypothetical protein
LGDRHFIKDGATGRDLSPVIAGSVELHGRVLLACPIA